MKKNLFLVLFFIFFLYGCGGGGSASSSSGNSDSNSVPQPSPTTYTGYLIDSAVGGIEYKCGTLSGITGTDGSFKFTQECSTVEFSLGKFYLGDINTTFLSDNIKIYPTDILGYSTKDINQTKVISLIRLLQSLDTDQNTTNDIFIDETTRNTILNQINIPTLNLKENIISEYDLNLTFKKIYPNRTLISSSAALADLNTTMKNNDLNTSSINPSKPTFVNPYNLSVITYNHLSTKVQARKFKIKGEAGKSIYYVLDRNDTNTSEPLENEYQPFDNLKIGHDGYQDITLKFNTPTVTSYHYYFILRDNYGKSSEPIELWIDNDTIPPHLQSTTIEESVFEEQKLFRNIYASDGNLIKVYAIIDSNESSKSTNWDLFQIDTDGTVTFKTEPNFDTNINAKFQVVARAMDAIGNMTDVLLKIILKNLLDNPPKLTASNYTKSISEGLPNGTTVFELNSTLEQNLTIAPDNDRNLSLIYYNLHNHTDIFDINRTTGTITIKDASNSLFDYEKLPNTIELNVSIENNNSHPSNDINTTYATLTVNITNKVDTSPKLIIPSPIPIDEKSTNYSSNYPIGGILINTSLSDYSDDKNDSTIVFSIVGGNDGNFSIDNNGIIYVTSSNNLDFETRPKYTLTIRATNTWTDDNSTHYDEVNQTIDLNNKADNPQVIILGEHNTTILESTDSNIQIAKFDVNTTISDHNLTTTSYTIISTLKNGVDIGTATPFTINTTNTTGILTTSRSLLTDYNETMTNIDTIFRITVQARNNYWDYNTSIPRYSYGESNIVAFDVNVVNVIDNPPVLKTPSSISVDENISVGTFLYDIDTNGTIYDENNVTSFAIVSGNTNDKFDINTTSGIITLSDTLNWEDTKNYTLGIQAINKSWNNINLNSSTKFLDINVTNIIEKVPSIYVPTSLSIHENIDDGYVLTLLETNSTETDEQSITDITISSGNDSATNFVIGNDETNTSIKNLKIKTGNTIDYEETNTSYDLNITATNGFGSKSYPLHIDIIDDVDPNVPFIILTVSVSDVNFTETITNIRNNISIPIKQYFNRVSYKKFNFIEATENFGDNTSLNGTKTDGIIKIDLNTSTHPDENPDLLQTIVQSALTKASTNNDINFSVFDKDKTVNGITIPKDGNISNEELQILVIVAEDENKTILDTQQGAYSFSTPLVLNGVNVASSLGSGSYIVVGEKDNNATITYGILSKYISQKLFNFQIENTNYKYGMLDIMGTGYQGHDINASIGSKPVHPSIFNKSKQGWKTPKVLSKGTYNIDFYNTHDNNDYNTIRVNTSDVNIYYLIENRNKTNEEDEGTSSAFNFDNGFDGLFSNFQGGLIIWKVEANKISVVPIANTTNNIFRPTNTPATDLPSDVRNIFEFTNVGSIAGDADLSGSKKYSIKIEVK